MTFIMFSYMFGILFVLLIKHYVTLFFERHHINTIIIKIFLTTADGVRKKRDFSHIYKFLPKKKIKIHSIVC